MDVVSQNPFCPKCGKPVADGVKFCGICGTATMTMEPQPDPHINELVAGRYRIKAHIATGGMGEVYLAEHETLTQSVAVKLLKQKYATDERLVARFFNEAKSYSLVRHPNAVSFLDFGRLNDGSLFIVTEFIDGISLTDFVLERGKLRTGLTVRLLQQVADAVAAAHERAIVHRDLKPDNIMITEALPRQYSAVVIDFGIAKLLGDIDGPQLTKTGAVFGTPEFMSPEQAQGVRVDESTDIYSLGVIAFFMLTGSAPFESQDPLDTVQRQISEPPPIDRMMRDASINKGLVALVGDCLSKDPGDRPESMLELLRILGDLTIGKAVGDLPTEPTPSPMRPSPPVAPVAPVVWTSPKTADPPEGFFNLKVSPPTDLNHSLDQRPPLGSTPPVVSPEEGFAPPQVDTELDVFGDLEVDGALEGFFPMEVDATFEGFDPPVVDLPTESPQYPEPPEIPVGFALLGDDADVDDADVDDAAGVDDWMTVPDSNNGPQLSPSEIHAEPSLAFGDSMGPAISVEDEFVWGDEDRPTTLGQELDVDPTEFDSSHLRGGQIPISWILAVGVFLALGVSGYLIFSALSTADDGLDASPEGTGSTVNDRVDDVSDQPSDQPSDQLVEAVEPVVEAPDPVVAVPQEPLPDRPFELIHSAARVSSAAALLRRGRIDEAAQAWEQSRSLLADGVELSIPDDIQRARELIIQAEAAFAEDECRRADRAVVRMRDISPALRRQFLRPLHECHQRLEQRGRPPRTLE